MADQQFVIVGASLSGAKTAEALRDHGFDGRITLVGAEPHRPYERPPLSKGLLLGSAERDSVFVHPADWYEQHGVDLRTGVTVASIDRDGRRVVLADGAELPYDRLLLATGARPRTLPVPGARAEGVHTLRTLDQAEQLAGLLGRIDRLVIVGAGWIGLEVAAAARSHGVEVTMVESAPVPLAQALGPEIGESFAALHREHGVDLQLGVQVEAILVDGAAAVGVRLAHGRVLPGDAVLVAVGAQPNVELAADAGLAVDDGVVVDAALRTSDPAIVAAGDVANAMHPRYGRHLRVEHWANALNQPAVAAATMLSEAAQYDRLPYFFTDQYDLGMEFVGLAAPGSYDEVVVRGDVASREYLAFWLSAGRVVGGMHVNVWDTVDDLRALIQSGHPVAADLLADPAVPLAELA